MIQEVGRCPGVYIDTGTKTSLAPKRAVAVTPAAEEEAQHLRRGAAA